MNAQYDRKYLKDLLLERSVRLGDFTLSSGAKSSYYIDARQTTMTAEGQRLTGKIAYTLIEEAGWDVSHVGGLTLGADPVAYAIAHHSTGRDSDSRWFHRTQRTEGPRNRTTDRRGPAHRCPRGGRRGCRDDGWECDSGDRSASKVRSVRRRRDLPGGPGRGGAFKAGRTRRTSSSRVYGTGAPRGGRGSSEVSGGRTAANSVEQPERHHQAKVIFHLFALG